MTAGRWFILGLGIIGISWSAPLIRLADPAPVLAIAALRLVFASPAMLAYASVRGVGDLRESRRGERIALVLSALALALHFALWIAALQRTSVVTGVVLVTMQPIFVGLGAWIVLRERPTRALVIGSAIALVGAALLAGDDLGDRGSLEGDLLALGGGLLSSAYLVIGRSARRRISTASYGASVYTLTALFLLVAVAVSGTPLTGHPASSYLAILAVAVVSQLIGHNAMNWALGFLPAAVVAIAILGEPVGATVIAAFVLDEVPTLLELAGAMVVLAGVYVALRHAAPVIAPEPIAPEIAAMTGPAKPDA
ncbi:MAG: DMT family transporter [Chloroflexi bacterium]|nr:DMT family transporter [Chloroflexota bacterium]MDA1145206.1 DMT family transporter [Chloroflexota bacterium]